MQTLTLDEAAAFLKTTPGTVADKIRREGLPAVKVGRAWVLVDADIVEWLRTQYPREEVCGSISASKAENGGAILGIRDAALDAALARPTAKPRKSTRTPSRLRSGALTG